MTKSKSDSFEFNELGNKATAICLTRSPHTLEQLIKFCQVDTKVWRVGKWKAIIRDMGSMPRSTRESQNDKWLRPSSKPIITPLYQINAEFERISPIAIKFPEVRPVEVSVPKAPALIKKKLNSDLRTALIIPDMQVGFRRHHRTGVLTPFHDRRCMDIVWAVNRELRPDRVVQLGDNFDFPEFGRFRKPPEFYFTAQPAIAELGVWEAMLVRDNPKAEHDYIEGNHDARFVNSIIEYNTAAYDLRPADDLDGLSLFSVPRLLGLSKLGINYWGPYPGGEVWINDNLMMCHGQVVRSESGATTKTVVKDARASEGQGHIHRAEMASKTVWSRKGPKIYQSWSYGTLASLDPGAVPGYKQRQNWQQAFGWIEYEEKNGFFHSQAPIIYGNVSYFNGRKWYARKEEQIIEEIEEIIEGKVKIR